MSDASIAGGSIVEIVHLHPGPAPGVRPIAPAAAPAAPIAPAASSFERDAAVDGSAAGPLAPRPGWWTTRRRPILGDGSAAGEILAAAQRGVGITWSEAGAWLHHVLWVAGVTDAEGPSPASFIAEARQALERAGLLTHDARAAVDGVLFYRDRPDGPARVAVVEANGGRGRLHVLGVADGVVTRSVVDVTQRHDVAIARL